MTNNQTIQTAQKVVQTIPYKELKCIKLTHSYDSTQHISYITFNQFYASFIKERWDGEKRYNKTYTMFGHVHTKTVVTNPYDKSKSIRTFDFPNSIEEAENIHIQNIVSIAVKEKGYKLESCFECDSNQFGKTNLVKIDNGEYRIVYSTNVLNGRNYFNIKEVYSHKNNRTYTSSRYFTKFILLISSINGEIFIKLYK